MKNKINIYILFFFLSFCFVVFYKGLNNSNTYIPKTDDKKSVPIFKAISLYSNSYISSEEIFKKNNFYLINIWASWCAPCKKEHPFLMELSKDKSLILIGFNHRDNSDNAKKFIKKFGNPYSQILIDDGTLSVEFGAYGVPETFIIDKNKVIIKKFVGPINQDILKEIKLIIE